jgi:hypothetical protein
MIGPVLGVQKVGQTSVARGARRASTTIELRETLRVLEDNTIGSLGLAGVSMKKLK